MTTLYSRYGCSVIFNMFVVLEKLWTNFGFQPCIAMTKSLN